MRRLTVLAALLVACCCCLTNVGFSQAIENELYLITPVSKDVHDPMLNAFAVYAKQKWNIVVKTSAIPQGTPVAYGQIMDVMGTITQGGFTKVALLAQQPTGQQPTGQQPSAKPAAPTPAATTPAAPAPSAPVPSAPARPKGG